MCVTSQVRMRKRTAVATASAKAVRTATATASPAAAAAKTSWAGHAPPGRVPPDDVHAASSADPEAYSSKHPRCPHAHTGPPRPVGQVPDLAGGTRVPAAEPPVQDEPRSDA